MNTLRDETGWLVHKLGGKRVKWEKRKIIVSCTKLGRKDLLQEKGNKEKIKLQCKDTPSLCVIEEAVREKKFRNTPLYRN